MRNFICAVNFLRQMLSGKILSNKKHALKILKNKNFVTRKSVGDESGNVHSMSCGACGAATKYMLPHVNWDKP